MNLMTEDNLPNEILFKPNDNQENEVKTQSKGDSARGPNSKRRYK